MLFAHSFGKMNLTLSQEREKSVLEEQLRDHIILQRTYQAESMEWYAAETRIEDLATDYKELTGEYFHIEYPITENID